MDKAYFIYGGTPNETIREAFYEAGESSPDGTVWRGFDDADLLTLLDSLRIAAGHFDRGFEPEPERCKRAKALRIRLLDELGIVER